MLEQVFVNMAKLDPSFNDYNVRQAWAEEKYNGYKFLYAEAEGVSVF
jgi:hypothetical protein